MPVVLGQGAETLLHSFISGMGERAALADLARLRIGMLLRLRRAARPNRGCSVEVLTAESRPLGWLPREDEAGLGLLGPDLDGVPVRVTGIIPAFQRPRVQIEIALPEPAAVVPAA